jgi:hypothetical protein
MEMQRINISIRQNTTTHLTNGLILACLMIAGLLGGCASAVGPPGTATSAMDLSIDVSFSLLGAEES